MEDILEEEEKERKKSSDSIEDIYISSKQQYSKIKNN